MDEVEQKRQAAFIAPMQILDDEQERRGQTGEELKQCLKQPALLLFRVAQLGG